MGGRTMWTGRRASAAAMVMLFAAAGCSTSGESESPVASPPLYANPTHGICRTLPFELLEQQIGRRYSEFGAWKFAFGAVETMALADTFVAECRMDTIEPADADRPTGLLSVNLHTYPTAAEAAAYLDTLPKGGGTLDLPAPDLGVDRATWQDTSAESVWATDIGSFVLDRNLVMTIDVRTGEKESDAPVSDTLRTTTGDFVAESIRRLRNNPPRPATRAAEAVEGTTYPAPAEGFCQQLPFSLFRDRLGEPSFGYPAEREYKGTHSCWMDTVGEGKNRGGKVALSIRHLSNAQHALDFHQTHLPNSPTLTPPAGVTLDVDALDWSYLPPTKGQDGVHSLRIAAGNLYLYLDVTGYSDNKVPLVDSDLAPTIAEFLRATLASLRG